jgi:alpha-beta hydrolase superfamily lysophospholipase
MIGHRASLDGRTTGLGTIRPSYAYRSRSLNDRRISIDDAHRSRSAKRPRLPRHSQSSQSYYVSSIAVTSPPSSWDEPEGIPPRGTVIILTGRGDTVATYGRLGRRLASDAYRVRAIEVDLDDLDATTKRVEKLLADETLPGPRVLLGTDSGAVLAAQLVETLTADAAVLAGLVLDSTAAAADSWEEELEARTACPTHRRVITEDASFARGALARPLPWPEVSLPAPTKPVLVLHGSLDPITSVDRAFAAYLGNPHASLHVVVNAHHDALNDLMHRSAAATVVLWLERLKLGADLPVIVSAVQ